MKRNIFLIAFMLFTCAMANAQVLVEKDGTTKKHEGSEKIVKIIFDANDIIFLNAANDIINYNVDDIHSIGFADDYAMAVEDIELQGKTTISYDSDNATVHIINPPTAGEIKIYNLEGALMKKGQGNTLNIADLKKGIYIVNYNKVYNAKIIKK